MNTENDSNLNVKRVIILSEEEYAQVIRSNSGDPHAFETIEKIEGSQPIFIKKKEKRWLTQEEAEAFLGRNTTSVWRYVKTGILHLRKRMGRNYYDRRELLTLISDESDDE